MLNISKRSDGRFPRIRSHPPHSGQPIWPKTGHQTAIPFWFFVFVTVFSVKSGMWRDIKPRPGGSVVIVDVTVGL